MAGRTRCDSRFARGATRRNSNSPAEARRPRLRGAAHGVAVLPFTNLSANAEDAYFSDGLTEELIHALTKYSGMRVVAWNSATRLRGVEQDLGEVRRQLNVAHVLTGSVRIAGRKLRVRAQFIDTATGVYVWSETFDRPMEDVFAIQEEIAQAIVAHAARPDRPWRRSGPRRQDADQRSGVRVLSERPLSICIGALRRKCGGPFSTSRRPSRRTRSRRVALSGVADAYTLDWRLRAAAALRGAVQGQGRGDRGAGARPGACRGVSLSRNHPVDCTTGSGRRAKSLYRRGIALNPGYATAHHWYALGLAVPDGTVRRGGGGTGFRPRPRPVVEHHPGKPGAGLHS